MNIALIVAGGSGQRMKTAERKQYLKIDGKPIIAHTLLVFEKCPQIDSILLVLPREDIDMVRRDILPPLHMEKLVRLIPGGRQRQDSVYNGLQHLDSTCRIVVIHDGVRPFVTPDQINNSIFEAGKSGACIVGIPAFDTLKRVTDTGIIEATLERQYVWLAQTPQAFRYNLIKDAHERARAANITKTDDAALVEHMGLSVKIIPGSRRNIKITTPEDLEFSKAMLI